MTELFAFTWANLFLIVSWIIRIGAFFIVPFRRTPAAARGWLLLFFIAPIPALLLFLAIGSPQHTRRRRALFERLPPILQGVIAKAGVDADAYRATLGQRSGPVSALAERMSNLPPLAGNSVELLPDYMGSIHALADAIDGAEQHVHLEFYIFADDATGDIVATALERAAARGVRCRVLIDAVGSLSSARKVIARLQKAGVDARRILPVHLRGNSSRFDLRNHRKIAVIDGRLGFTGSQNIIDAKPSEIAANIELVVRIRGPVVAELQAVFLADWYLETEDVLEGDYLFAIEERSGSVSAQLVPSGPDYAIGGIDLLFVEAMARAREEVVIVTPYFVPDQPIIAAMTTAALRGVRMRLVVSRRSNGRLVELAQRSYYAELMRAGVEIHLSDVGFIHAKHMRIDKEIAIVGSCNMDVRSFRLNAEATLFCYDRPTAEELAAIEERYYARGEQLVPDKWAARPLYRKTLENSARMLSDLL